MNNIIEKTYLRDNEKGLSLIELVVAVFVFSMVVMAASGIFANAIKAQRLIFTKQNVAEDTRYVMEFMVKELRMTQVNTSDLALTFKKDDETSFRDASLSSITFINSAGKIIKYFLSAPDANGFRKIFRNDSVNGDQPITSDNVSVTFLSFTLNNWDLTSGIGTAPSITILIKAKSTKGAEGQVEMQTSVSPRIY